MQMPRAEIEAFRSNVAARCAGHGEKVRLAESAGISAVFLSKIINGHSEPSYETALKIAEALKVPLWELSGTPGKKVRQTA
jgi:transcriptional regulator with XRE-family HTH domain